MKKLWCILLFLSSGSLYAQQNQAAFSPLNYMWLNVGIENFSGGEADYTSLAFSPAGQPYVAYKDYVNLKKASVKKFNGTSWIDVGIPGFSAGESSYNLSLIHI